MVESVRPPIWDRFWILEWPTFYWICTKLLKPVSNRCVIIRRRKNIVGISESLDLVSPQNQKIRAPTKKKKKSNPNLQPRIRRKSRGSKEIGSIIYWTISQNDSRSMKSPDHQEKVRKSCHHKSFIKRKTKQKQAKKAKETKKKQKGTIVWVFNYKKETIVLIFLLFFTTFKDIFYET